MKQVRVYNLNEENKTAMSIYFMGYDFVKENNITLSLDLYNMVWEGEVEDDVELDDLFRMLNIGTKPEDFKGHSLSTSDMVEMDGKYYYCDDYGWEEVFFPTDAPKKYIVTADHVSYVAIYDTKAEADAKAETLNDEYYQHKVWNVEEITDEDSINTKSNNKTGTTMKKTEKKVTQTTDEKVFNLCVESAKQSENGYTFDLKAVWQAARLKYKMAKQTVIDVFEIITKEHEVKKGEQEGQFVLTELMPKPDPVMLHWQQLKENNPEAILLFRCGDFYEAYNEDATECAKILGITLTQAKDGRKMAGFPYHALDTYLPKLVRAGKRCAICDDIANPKAKARKFEAAEKEGEVKEVKKEKKEAPVLAEGEDRPRGYGRFLTDCEIINIKAKKLARKLYPEFKSFGFARYDETNNKEYKNQGEALRAKADMNNLKHTLKVVDGVHFTGATRIEAYQNFLNAMAI